MFGSGLFSGLLISAALADAPQPVPPLLNATVESVATYDRMQLVMDADLQVRADFVVGDAVVAHCIYAPVTAIDNHDPRQHTMGFVFTLRRTACTPTRPAEAGAPVLNEAFNEELYLQLRTNDPTAPTMVFDIIADQGTVEASVQTLDIDRMKQVIAAR